MLNLQAILDALDAAGLENRRDEAAALLQPALRLTTVPTSDAALPVGASKMGGEPDLPPSTPWPHWNGVNGASRTPRPLHFLAQINFSDTAILMPDSLLPSSGLLSVFYDAEEQPWDEDGFRVLYTPETETLIRCEIPAAFWALADLNALFSPCALRFEETIPLHPLRRMNRLSSESVALEKVRKQFDPESRYGAHQMLGFADYVQNEVTFAYALNALEIEYGDVAWEEEDSPQMQMIRNEADKWVLLLQIDSDDAEKGKPGWMWGDAGMLYFQIHERDLAARDFSRVRMELQCG